MRLICCYAGVWLIASTCWAQSASNPYTTAIRQQPRRIDAIVVRAVEKVPEEVFAFKPTPEVRTFGEIVGHIVDAHYLLCRAAHENVFELKREHEKAPGTKAELNLNAHRTWEHYGNLVTYMRMKGIVSPTTETSR